MPLLSQRYPLVYVARVTELRLERRLADLLSGEPFAHVQQSEPLPIAVVHHHSLLRRRLGSTDPTLQDGKVENLRIGIKPLDGLLIRPGEVFSFWRRIGQPSSKRGYREGVILRAGRATTGVGGGLCQLANLLHWMALHTPLEIAERHHHSFDPFPDDRRALPFGTGASIFYNYVDFRLRNTTDRPFQLQLWLTDRDLHGRVLTTEPLPVRYHVFEVGHRFEASPEGVVRCNEVWRRRTDAATGDTVGEELLMRNRSLVGYEVDPERIESDLA